MNELVKHRDIPVVCLKEGRRGKKIFGPDPTAKRAARWSNQMTAQVLVYTDADNPNKWWDISDLARLNFKSATPTLQKKVRDRIGGLVLYTWEMHHRVIIRETVRVLDPRAINDRRKVPLKGRLRIARIKLAGSNERAIAKSEIEELFRRKEISRNVYGAMLDAIKLLPAPDEAAE